MPKTTRFILTGVPPYRQDYISNGNGTQVMSGCGPVAGLMLMEWYDRALGYQRLTRWRECSRSPRSSWTNRSPTCSSSTETRTSWAA